MATASPLSTSLQGTSQTVMSSDPTGTWRHPRFEEISRRLDACTFSDRNVKTIVWSMIYLALTIAVPAVCDSSSHLQGILAYQRPYPFYVLTACRVLLLLNMLYAFSPLLRSKDDLSDIPLTPSQRQLLGLDQSARPATPGSQYITPPRYARSSTPHSRGSSQSASPYSGRGSPLGGIGSGTPYSPNASPLFHKAMGAGVTRRLSYGTPSPGSLSNPLAESSGSLLGNSSSPTAGRTASVGLNSRWLFERGKSSPSLRTYYS